MIKSRVKILFIALTMLVSCKKDNTGNLTIEDHDLPVFELTVDQKYLWSPDSGLYVIGMNGADKCKHIANYNQDWEYPINIRFYEGGELKFDHNIGFRIKGTCSRRMGMKSIGLYWRSEYPNSSLTYPMFEGNPVTKFNRLYLRNSGQDFGITQMKDGTITDVFKGIAKVEYQDYRPGVVYLNGEYWGIQNIREMVAPWYFQNKYGINRNTVDLIGGDEFDPEIDDGTNEDWKRDVIDFIQSNDLSIPENYQTIQNRIDIESFIDYIIVQTYIGTIDWPGWNSKWWRSKAYTNYQKWKWVLYDLDLSMLMIYKEKVWIGDLYKNHTREGRESGFFVFNNLIKNEEFVDAFLQRYLYFIDEVFEPSRFNDIVLRNKARIQNEYPNHAGKWHTRSPHEWSEEVNKLIEFNNKRNKMMRRIIESLIEEHS